MNICKKIRKYLLARAHFLPDEVLMKKMFKLRIGQKLDLDNPKTFNEKLQWLKLNDRKDIYTTMVDKYEAKKYVADIIGEKYIIPTIGVYEKFEDINFDELPERFVIKCTHDSGGLVIVNNKNTMDYSKARKKIGRSLKRNFYFTSREWPYKNVKPRVIIEELLENKDGSEVVEYNFFCFNGVPKIVMTCHGDKRVKRYNDFYDIEFNKLDFGCGYEHTNGVEKPPKAYGEMIDLSKKLSRGFPFLRVDFYLVDGKIMMGELTLYHWSGYGKFSPEIWDKKLGDMLDLDLGKERGAKK